MTVQNRSSRTSTPKVGTKPTLQILERPKRHYLPLDGTAIMIGITFFINMNIKYFKAVVSFPNWILWKIYFCVLTFRGEGINKHTALCNTVSTEPETGRTWVTNGWQTLWCFVTVLHRNNVMTKHDYACLIRHITLPISYAGFKLAAKTTKVISCTTK